MKVVVTPRARAQLDHQLSYGIERFGYAAAERTFDRVEHFFLTTLAMYPRTGRRLSERNLYESYIPRTPFVVIYRIDAGRDLIAILGFFHHAQQRE
jgi:plasmid stabilization system protein ParE